MSIQETGEPVRPSSPSRLSSLSGILAAFLWVVSMTLVDSFKSPGLRGVVATFETHATYAAGIVWVGVMAAGFWFARLLHDRLEVPYWLACCCVVFGVGAMIVCLGTAASPILVLWCLCASIMLLPSRQGVLARR